MRLLQQQSKLCKQQATQSFNTATQSLDRLLRVNQNNIADTLQSLNVASANLRAFTANVKANPSSVIFAKPPVVDPGKL